MVTLNIYKNSANKFGRKTGFKIENEIEDQDQSIPKLIGILTQVFCTFGPNLVILAWRGDELSCRQAQNGVTFDFEVKFDLEGQGQSPPKTIGILTKFFYTYGPNLVILAWIARTSKWLPTDTDGRTDGHTDRRRQRQYPEGQNWPRVKIISISNPDWVKQAFCSNLHWRDNSLAHFCWFIYIVDPYMAIVGHPQSDKWETFDLLHRKQFSYCRRFG